MDYLKNIDKADANGMSTANEYIKNHQIFDSAINTQQQYKTNELLRINPDGTKVYKSSGLYTPYSNGFGYNTKLTPNLDIDTNVSSSVSNLCIVYKLSSNLSTNIFCMKSQGEQPTFE
jgi:hypothetical protein